MKLFILPSFIALLTLSAVSYTHGNGISPNEYFYHLGGKVYPVTSKIPDGVLHPLRVLGLSVTCNEWNTVTHDGFQEIGVPDPRLEVSVCALMNILPGAYRDSFLVLDYGMYPFLALIDRGEAHENAFQCMKEKVENEFNPPYYLLIGKQINPEDASVEFKVALKLPKWGPFAELNSALEEGFKNQVLQAIQDSYDDLGELIFLVQNEIAGVDKLRELITGLLNGAFSGSMSKELLELNGFRELLTDPNYPATFQNTNNKYTSFNSVKDYAGLNVQYGGNFVPVNTFAEEAIIGFQSLTQNELTAAMIFTDNANYSPGSNNDFQIANGQFNGFEHNVIIWFHYFEPTDPALPKKMYYKCKGNFTPEEAEELVDLEYEMFRNNGGIARHGQAKANSSPDCTNADCGGISSNWRAGCCWLPNVASFGEDIKMMLPISYLGTPSINETVVFIGGIGCGIIDGAINTLVFLYDIGSGLEKTLKHTLFTPLWFLDALQEVKKQNSFFTAIKAKFSDDVNYYGGILNNIYQLVTILSDWNSLRTILNNIVDALVLWLEDLTFQNGTANAGYEYGILVFDLVIDFLTGGTSKAAKLSKKIVKEFVDVLKNSSDEFGKILLKAWDSAKDAKKITCKILLGGCFVNGTPVWTAGGLIPINNLKPVLIEGVSVNYLTSSLPNPFNIKK